MPAKRRPLFAEHTPYEARRWAAADSAAEGYVEQAARLFREAAMLAPDEEEKAFCLKWAASFEERGKEEK